MADIVNSLFGFDPDTLQRQRDVMDSNQAYRFAQLDPLQRANMALYQGGAGIGRGVTQLLGGDEQLNRATSLRQLASQFDLTTPEGLQQYAQAAISVDPRVATAAAGEAERRRGLSLATQKTQMDISKAERALAQDEKLREELSKLPPNATEKQYLEVFRKFGTPDQQARMIQASIDRQAAIAARAAAQGAKVMPMTPAQKAADSAFGKDYNDFVSGGGISTIQKNLADIDKVIAILESGENVSGKVVGLADASGTLSYLFPKAAESKDLLGGVAQSNLRQILGGQFAAREGEQLLARAYNTAQPVSDNLRRVKALRDQIQTAANAKIQAVNYFEENGTLAGFKPAAFGAAAANISGNVPSAEDPLGLRKKSQQGNK
jgi:DNA-binding phage protein